MSIHVCEVVASSLWERCRAHCFNGVSFCCSQSSLGHLENFLNSVRPQNSNQTFFKGISHSTQFSLADPQTCCREPSSSFSNKDNMALKFKMGLPEPSELSQMSQDRRLCAGNKNNFALLKASKQTLWDFWPNLLIMEFYSRRSSMFSPQAWFSVPSLQSNSSSTIVV